MTASDRKAAWLVVALLFLFQLINSDKSGLAGCWGTVDRWRAEFVGMGKALSGGSGWVLLTYSHRDRTLTNQWAADHAHALAGGTPILALDMYVQIENAGLNT